MQIGTVYTALAKPNTLYVLNTVRVLYYSWLQRKKYFLKGKKRGFWEAFPMRYFQKYKVLFFNINIAVPS